MKKILFAVLLMGISINLNANISKNDKDAPVLKQKSLEQIEIFSKACDNGNAEGCYNLGFIYNTGKGAEKDYVNARKYYVMSCDAGYARACTRLGLLYGKGKGVKKDMTKANKLFKKACEGGHQDGCMIYNALNKK